MNDTVHRIVVNRHPTQDAPVVSPELFGFNLEITRCGGWQGLAAEMVANRKFAALGKEGFPLHWMADGDGDAATLRTGDGYAGNHSVAISLRSPGRFIGIAQSGENLRLTENREYAVRLAAETDRPRRVILRLTGLEAEDAPPAAELTWEIAPGGWRHVTGRFRANLSGPVLLEIGGTEPGVFRIGAVSLQPADAFYGMRRDVVELLRSLHPAALRYPGGCYAEFYRWREALLPVDRRPPIGPTNLPFLLPECDDYDCHEIGINEFLALCREIGAAPAITVRMNEAEPRSAAELVEYCNGSADTEFGALRTAHAPEGTPPVHTWFIGNELWSFGHDGLDRAALCAERTRLFAEAMLARDPSVELIGCSFYDRWEWNSKLVAAAGELLGGYSQHHYLFDNFNGRLAETAAAPETVLLPQLRRVRDQFRLLAPARRYGIVFDEWNYRWGSQGTVGMAVYVAGVLHLLCREAAELDISKCFYFMAINEGIVNALDDPARLDLAGIIFDLVRAHAGQRLLNASGPDALDVVATGTPDTDEFCVTILNRSVSAPAETELLPDGGASRGPLECTVWEPLLPDVSARRFRLRQTVLTPDGRGAVRLTLPPGGFARLRTRKSV